MRPEDGHKALYIIRNLIFNPRENRFSTFRPQYMKQTSTPTRTQQSRQFSTAVYQPSTSYFPSPSTARRTKSSTTTTANTDFWTPRHAASDYDNQADFLEDIDSSEYTALPSRMISTSSSASASDNTFFTTNTSSNKTRRCDSLARLVEEGDLETAKTVYQDLIALKIPIMRRTLYYSAAMRILRDISIPIDIKKEHVLFWLELIPNRPAVVTHPANKEVYSELINIVIEEHTKDIHFIMEILDLSARKGMLPSIHGPLIRHLCYILPGDEVISLTRRLVGIYWQSTTSEHSRSERALAHAVSSERMVNAIWNSCVRSLKVTGWEVEAKTLMDNSFEGIEWTPFSKGYPGSIQSKDSPLSLDMESLAFASEIEDEKLQRQVQRCSMATVKPAFLAETLAELQHQGYESICNQLEYHYRRIEPFKLETFLHAKLLLLRAEGDEKMIKYFMDNFVPIGLPNHPFLQRHPSVRTPQARKMYPSLGVTTTILAPLLSTLPSDSILTFHSEYFSSIPSLPPQLRPNSITHNLLIRQITHLLGPHLGYQALLNTVSHDITPELEAYDAILWGLAGRGKWNDCLRFLGGMEAEAAIFSENGLGVKMKRPDRKSYKGLTGILEKKGMIEEAEMIRRKVRMVKFDELPERHVDHNERTVDSGDSSTEEQEAISESEPITLRSRAYA